MLTRQWCSVQKFLIILTALTLTSGNSGSLSRILELTSHMFDHHQRSQPHHHHDSSHDHEHHHEDSTSQQKDPQHQSDHDHGQDMALATSIHLIFIPQMPDGLLRSPGQSNEPFPYFHDNLNSRQPSQSLFRPPIFT